MDQKAVGETALTAARVGLLLVLGLVVGLVVPGTGVAQPGSATSKVVDALDNVRNLKRPSQDGYATVWDGNNISPYND